MKTTKCQCGQPVIAREMCHNYYHRNYYHENIERMRILYRNKWREMHGTVFSRFRKA
jgi:hypothetical protein